MTSRVSSPIAGGVEAVRETDGDGSASITPSAVFVRRWWVLALGAALGASLGMLFAKAPPLYEASTTVFLTPVFEPSGLATATGLHVVLNNQTNASAVLEQLGLSGGETPAVDPGRFLRDALTIEQVRNGYFFRIRVRMQEPLLASRAANALSERAVELMTRLWLDALAPKSKAAENELEAARLALEAAEKRLMQHKESNSAPARAAKDPPKMPDAELASLAAQVEIKRLTYIEAGARFERARAELGATTPPLRLVDRAVAPGQRVSLSARHRIAFGVLAGLVAAACLAVALESRQFLRGSTSHGAPR